MMSARSSQVYKKLILSHTVIILIISILLGSASFLFFTWNYNQEIKKYNEQMLTHKKAGFISSVTNKLTDISYSILSNFQGRNAVTKLFDGPLLPSDWKITQAYTYMNQIILQNTPMIESIFLYCPENNLFLSTVSGSNHIDFSDPEVRQMTDYLDTLIKTSQCLVYECPVDVYSTEDIQTPRIMLYSTYPLSPLSGSGNGLLCITVRSTWLDSYMNDGAADPFNMTFLLSQNMEMINRQSGFPETLISDERFLNLLYSGKSFLYTYDGSSYVISAQSADSTDSSVLTGFYIVNASLTDSFRGRSTYYIWFLISICLGAIAVGTLIAFRFSKNLYRPLKETVTRISKDLPESQAGNEYNMIDEYISLLHQKASKNQDLIYHTVICSILTSPLDAQEIEKLFFSAGIEIPYASFRIFIVEFRSAPLTGAILSFHPVRDRIRQLSNPSLTIHAAFTEENRLGILINADVIPADLPERILAEAQSSSDTAVKLFLSSLFDDIAEIHGNYAALLNMRRYEYFFPERICFDRTDFYKKDLSAAHLATGISSCLAPMLRNRRAEDIRSLLERMRREIQEKDYSYESCSSRIMKTIYILSEYIKESRLEKELPLETIHSNLSSLPDINIFTEKYMETVEAAWQMLDSRSQSQNMDVVRRIQEYILENLQSDISLDDAARLVSLSPQYVSRLFRDAIGITFVAFIKKCKMEKAKELLLQPDKNVDQAAMELGYNSTAYFIKNFKDTYGITPKAWQRQNSAEKNL